jgi:hypothetical protein
MLVGRFGSLSFFASPFAKQMIPLLSRLGLDFHPSLKTLLQSKERSNMFQVLHSACLLSLCCSLFHPKVQQTQGAKGKLGGERDE